MPLRNTNKTLRQTYQRLNRRYFDGKLDVTVVFADLSDIDAEGCYHCDEIEVDNVLRYAGQGTVEIVLLHEMVHAEMPDYEGHGMRFQARIVELFNAGAYDGLL